MKKNILIQAEEDIKDGATLEEVIETLKESFQKIDALNLEQKREEKLKADLWKIAHRSLIEIANSKYRAMENSALLFLFSPFVESLNEIVDSGYLKWNQLNFSQIDLLNRLIRIKDHETMIKKETSSFHKQK